MASGTNHDNQMRALLLHCSGEAAQDIFETLQDVGPSYDDANETLNGYFIPKRKRSFREIQLSAGSAIAW
jgi:hypothetical protein